MAGADQAIKQKYRGNCHCGAFVFELDIPEIKSTQTCNCSICTKRSYIWVMAGVDLTIIKDEGTLVDYSYGPKNLIHKSCGKCGVAVFSTSDTNPPSMKVGVNARALQNLDFYNLKTTDYGGAALGAKYEPTPYTGPEPQPTTFTDGKVYHGSCHCGAVTAALKVPTSLEDKSYKEPIMECNCSLCRRIGATWIYPTHSQLVVQGKENLTPYAFGHKSWRRWFCKTCAVYIFTDVNDDLTAEELAALPEGVRGFREKMGDRRPFNLRVLDEFDLGSVDAKLNDGWKNQTPEYVNP
ncbi:hypothetical protein QBC43DRAFT_26100 [Cladorrhinum sp. PSN259]|nr:hypothetical protein QBC43DRAFT_26100 [Cladorrhinum sp. PSN259]